MRGIAYAIMFAGMVIAFAIRVAAKEKLTIKENPIDFILLVFVTLAGLAAIFDGS
jgi:hypothetical protein